MKNALQQHFSIAIHLVIIVAAICIGVFVSYSNTKEIVASVQAQIELHEKRIIELSEITDRNGADEETASIISDCPRREDYEGYLVRLASLNKQELIIMQNLFDACSPFYTEQKMLMVSKLAREFESYQTYITLLDTLTDTVAYTDTLSRFSTLVTIERERSALIVDQTKLQAQIITLLISGKSAYGAEVAKLLSEAQQVNELLSVLDHRADEIRTHFEK